MKWILGHTNRKLLRAVLLSLYGVIGLAASCKTLHSGDTLQAEAIVLVGIPAEADGCGNMLYIDSVFYRVENLPVDFLHDELRVQVSYIPTDTFYCGRGRSPIPAVRVITIQKTEPESSSGTNTNDK